MDAVHDVWDGELEAAGSSTTRLEGETVLHDLQAQERRIALKMADHHVDGVVPLVADTRRDRNVERESRELLAMRFPLHTRAAMRRSRAGLLPERSGVVRAEVAVHSSAEVAVPSSVDTAA